MRQRQPAPRYVLATLAVASAALLPAIASVPAHARPAMTAIADAQPPAPRSAGDRTAAFLVRLDGPAAASAATTARRRGASLTQAAQQSRRQRADNVAAQTRMLRTARARGLVDHELYRLTTADNGVAVLASTADVDRLRSLSGVHSVVSLPKHERTNAMSVPAIGAPAAWAAPGGLTGQGVRVGVIDTGIDYVHRAFGGSGDPADLTYARSSAANPALSGPPSPSFTVTRPGGGPLYPSARVVGGFDFAGDAYDADNAATAVPRPDQNPLDCPLTAGGGHGTHVAGTVGGDGVASDGGTLAWQSAWPPATAPVVGTGVAPGASLLALRVFGCNGTTNLVPRAIEWAIDPNGDGDTSDHLDVLNLSLGAPFGSQEDPSTVAMQNAVAAGVVVVTSAGNSGDQTYQMGSPGVAPRAITVANMASGGWRDAIEVTGASPASGANGLQEATFAVDFRWDGLTTPVVAALHRPTSNVTGCTAFGSGEQAAINGRIVVLDWLSGGTSPCGSAARVANARNAGAVGVVLATTDPVIGVSIAGIAAIPSAYVAGPTRSRLLAALADGGATVRFDRNNVATGYDASRADTVNDSSSRGPAGGGGLKPDLAAPGTDIRSAAAGTGHGAVALSGTSMAAPHVAGAMAILRQRHPTWTVEELKAAAVNTADPDLYAGPGHTGARHTPARVGTGTIDVAAAVETDVVAFADDADGAVGVSFGPLRIPVGAPFVRDRAIAVVNHGTTAATYAIQVDERGAVPGVVWQLPDGPTITVPAGERRSFVLRLRVDDPAQLRNVRDATLAPSQPTSSGTLLRRRWLAEATGLVRLSAAGRPTLSVAAHASVRPAAATHATTTAVELPAGATGGTIPLAGSAFSTGSTVTDFAARRTMLELQATSPQRTVASGDPAYRRADVRYVGVGASSDDITFGVVSWGPSPAPAGFRDVEIAIDANRDGTPERYVYPSRLKDSDIFVTCIWNALTDTSTGCYLASSAPDVAAAEGGTYDSEILTMTVPRSAIGLGGSAVRFAYTVRTWVAGGDEAVDTVGPLTWSPGKPGVGFATADAVADAPATVPFAYDPTTARLNSTLGALILHHLGTDAQVAEAVRVTAEDSPDVGPPVDVDPPVVVDPPTTAPPVVLAPPVASPPSVLAPPTPPPPPTSRQRCRVPTLTGRTLSAARSRLRRAHCALGRVTKPKPRTVRGKRVKLRPLVVARQSVKAGASRKAGTKVAVRMRERPRR